MEKQNDKHDSSSNGKTNNTSKSNSDGLLNSPLQRGGFDEVKDGVLNSPLAEGWQTKSDGVLTSPGKSDRIYQNYKKLPYNPKLKQRARELRKAGNLAEVLFWNQVKRKKFLGLDFHRQKIIGNYIVDFYCPALQLVVEIDGSSHNDKIEYDKTRNEYLKSLDLSVIHYRDADIKKNLNSVMENLKEYSEKLLNTPPFGPPSTEGKKTPHG